MRLEDTLVSEDEHFRINFVWDIASLAIDALDLVLNLADQSFDLLGDGVVFVINCLLLESLQVQHSVSLLGQHVLG